MLNLLTGVCASQGSYNSLSVGEVDFTTESAVPSWLTFERDGSVAYVTEDGSSIVTDVDIFATDTPYIEATNGLHIEAAVTNHITDGTFATWDNLGTATVVGGQADPAGGTDAETITMGAKSYMYDDTTLDADGDYVYGFIGKGAASSTYALVRANNNSATYGGSSSALDLPDANWRKKELAFTSVSDGQIAEVRTQWNVSEVFTGYFPYVQLAGWDYLAVHDGTDGIVGAASLTTTANADQDYIITHTPEGGSETTTAWATGASFPSLPAGTIKSILYGSAASSVWGSLNENTYRGGSPIARNRTATHEVDADNTINIAAGTHTIASIQALIDAVPSDESFELVFSSGTINLTPSSSNRGIVIDRGDFAIYGAGYDSTILNYDGDKADVGNVFLIHSDAMEDNPSDPDRTQFTNGTPLTTLHASENFVFGDHSFDVVSAAGISIGDYILLNKLETASPALSNLNKVTGISGTTITVERPLGFSISNLDGAEDPTDIDVHVVNLLENVSVHDFQVTYTIDSTALNNPEGHTEAQMLQTRHNFWPYYAKGSDYSGSANLMEPSNASCNFHYAMVVAGCYEPNIYNMKFIDVGSSALLLSMCVAPAGDNPYFSGTHSRGHGGNGYAFEIYMTSYADFTNVVTLNFRHGVTAKDIGCNNHNNFHILNSTCNHDFHGGRDQGNIYSIDYCNPVSLWDIVNGDGGGTDTSTYEIDFDTGLYGFTPMNYRESNNESENTVVFKESYAIGHDAVATTSSPYQWEEGGDKIKETHNSHDDIMYAHPDGATLNGGIGDDTIVSGIGDDMIYCGVKPFNPSTGLIISSGQGCNNVIRFYDDSGNDTISGFHEDYDAIDIESDINGEDMDTATKALAACSNSGSDVILDLGSSNTVTILDVQVADLTTANFAIFTP